MQKKIGPATSFKVIVFVTLATLWLGCAASLVSPYDQRIVSDTQAFYKKAAGFIEEGRLASPKTDEARKSISKPADHDGHFSKFEPKYNSLLIDSEALILRAMASSGEIDALGIILQNKLDDLIDANLPSACEKLANEFGNMSLTAKNFIDLKCIVIKWKERHADPRHTGGAQILKKANWEGRKRTIFHAILAIHKAEGSKKTGKDK